MTEPVEKKRRATYQDILAVVPDGVAFTIVPDWICEVLSKSRRG